MAILSQSFFTLMSRHLMSFLLLSVWHNSWIKILLNDCFSGNLLNALGEALCRLERGDVVLGNNDGRVLRYVTSRFLSTLFQNETAKSTQVYILLVFETLFYSFH